MKDIGVFLALMLILLLPLGARADEFSGKEIGREWRVVDPRGLCEVRQRNGVLAVMSGEGSRQNKDCDGGVKLLRDALAGEWIIETDLIERKVADGEYLHGLVVWKDARNYLSFGCAGNLAVARGVIGGEDTGVIAKGTMARYLRVRKITRGLDHAAYHFYIAENGYQSFRYIGSFFDDGDALDGAEYGLIGSSGKAGSAAYDSFTDRLPVGEFDAFFSGRLDGLWTLSDGVRASQSNALKLSGTAEASSALALRAPYADDWTMDTSLQSRSDGAAVNGLIVYQNEENFLLLGARGQDEIAAIARVNGEQTEIAATNGADTRFRIEKRGGVYALSHSTDGSEWRELCAFTDQSGALTGARYGFGAVGGEGGINVSYGFFREKRTPEGIVAGVKRVTEIGPMIGAGERVVNDTSAYGWLGADLGHFVDAGDKVYMMFGDSNSAVNQSGRFWSNTLTVIEDDAPEDGLTFSRVITGNSGGVKEVITAKHADYDEVTCIPNTGVLIGDRLYYHYMSVYHWNDAGHWDVNGSGWAWSDDGGESFTREPLCFAGDDGFVITCALRADGYVYLYGIPSSKFEGVRLARFKEEDILRFDRYEYCAGEDNGGNAVWSGDIRDAAVVIPGCTGEFCVFWHPVIGRYLILNQNVHTMDIELRESDRLAGGFGAPVTLVDHTVPAYNAFIYSPNTLSRYVREEGRALYFTLTRWNPYVVYWEKAELALREE